MGALRAGLLSGCNYQAYRAPTLVGLTREQMDKRFIANPEAVKSWHDAVAEARKPGQRGIHEGKGNG